MKRLVIIAFVCGQIGQVGLFAESAGQAPRQSQLFNSAALLSDLKTLSSDAMNGRAVDSLDGAKARAFLAERLQTAGLKPFGTSPTNASAFEQPFTFKAGGRAGAPVVERHGVNLVGEIAGRRRPARYVVVTAHYDHLAPRNGAVMNGADDNASGAAALVAITEYFVKHRPDNSLIIVACDAEEVGLRGAQAFVMNPPVPAASLVVNVNLDMIGRDPDDTLFAVGTLLSPYLKPLVEEVAKTAPVKLLIGHDDPARAKAGPGVIVEDDWTRDSDHYQFWTMLKMPFIYLGVEDESQHHKATDDYETITHDFYVRAVETSIALIRNFDKNLDRIGAATAAARQIAITPVVNAIVADEAAAKQTAAPPPPFVYSDGYHTRLKIHKAASFTYLPLVAAQGVLGRMLYDNPTPARRTWHKGVAWGIGGLFAVNSVTGTWNLIESRKDSNGRKRRVIHSILMLASDAGFLATAMSAPSSREKDAFKYLDDRSGHRTLAIASISTATVGYLIMLFK